MSTECCEPTCKEKAVITSFDGFLLCATHLGKRLQAAHTHINVLRTYTIVELEETVEERDTLIARLVSFLHCERTGHQVGTDTMAKDIVCPCAPCKAAHPAFEIIINNLARGR